jgi:hypothetical protein
MGIGEEMKRWAFAVKARPAAARAVLMNMFAVMNERVLSALLRLLECCGCARPASACFVVFSVRWW